MDYKTLLTNYRKAIADGMILRFFDDETVGAKDTQATWGLCSCLPDLWGRTKFQVSGQWMDGTPIFYFQKGTEYRCPMDKREEPDPWGCYYHCRIFQGPKPSREEALKLYDLSIERLK